MEGREEECIVNATDALDEGKKTQRKTARLKCNSSRKRDLRELDGGGEGEGRMNELMRVPDTSFG